MSQRRRTTSSSDLDAFMDAYIEAALWSSTDNADESGGEPMDKNYGPGDLADSTKIAMQKDCASFVDRFDHLIGDDDSPAIEKWGRWPKAGHDFWLSRNGHGAGFFDGDWPQHGDELQEGAESYGTFELYVGDDKEIYAFGHEDDGGGRANERLAVDEHRDPTTGKFAAGPGPSPTGEWAVIQRMMKVYAEAKGLGAYVHNSAIPTGRHGEWRFWAQKPGERSKEHQVSTQHLKNAYERGGLSEHRPTAEHHRRRSVAHRRGHAAPRVRDYDVTDNRGKRLAGPFKDYGQARSEADSRGGVVGFVAGERGRVAAPRRRRAVEWNQIGQGNAHVGDEQEGFWATFPKGTSAQEVLELYLDTADYSSATGAFTVTAEIEGRTASARVGPGGERLSERGFVAGELRAPRREALRFVAGIWGQEAEDNNGDGLVVWSRHATAEAAKKAAIGYARRLHQSGSSTGGALSWSGGWKEIDGKVQWVDRHGDDQLKKWHGDANEQFDSRLREGGSGHEVGCPAGMAEASRRRGRATKRRSTPPAARRHPSIRPQGAVSITSVQRPDLNGEWSIAVRGHDGDPDFGEYPWEWLLIQNGADVDSGSARTKAEATKQGRLRLGDIQKIAKRKEKGWARRTRETPNGRQHSVLSRRGSKMMEAEAKANEKHRQRRLREADPETAGERYVEEQLQSDYFNQWAYGQMVEARRMRKADPKSVIPLENAADYKKLARNMLQQLGWDMERDMDMRAILDAVGVESEGTAQDAEVAREFAKGVRAMLFKPSTINWLASDLRRVETELKRDERGTKGGGRKKASESRGPKLLPPARR